MPVCERHANDVPRPVQPSFPRKMPVQSVEKGDVDVEKLHTNASSPPFPRKYTIISLKKHGHVLEKRQSCSRKKTVVFSKKDGRVLKKTSPCSQKNIAVFLKKDGHVLVKSWPSFCEVMAMIWSSHGHDFFRTRRYISSCLIDSRLRKCPFCPSGKCPVCGGRAANLRGEGRHPTII